jgi:hypothetical protein
MAAAVPKLANEPLLEPGIVSLPANVAPQTAKLCQLDKNTEERMGACYGPMVNCEAACAGRRREQRAFSSSYGYLVRRLRFNPPSTGASTQLRPRGSPLCLSG